ncbi:DUF397 domain-containing protein [Marinactinospora thermotolerans]|uniref:DUF397 domain-containing protein n=1 Tax=Marinactinospora thermotolerans DSM 45154 TaxID=1122192 RepID=A0A1T4RSW3_9ACTN|nr:DUF397 domain-containing protein [Marinactinospora thermotolerans]SKA18838.1 protein of unknown function [Marinactinospora thermotolerans DSM 45154]
MDPLALSAPWRKSSYSNGNGGNCVEVADLHDATAVRDSKHPDGGHLVFTATEWSAFLTTLKHGGL